jgi:2,3-bisphosphoglycerate-dependent phosphoglycerate mutase
VGRRVLALIRHGEYSQPAGVPSAHLPYGLTSDGVARARQAAASVALFARQEQLTVHAVIDCSPLRRAWETAQLMGQGLDELERREGSRRHDCREVIALAERSVGPLANLSVTAIEAIVRDDPRHASPPPGWKRDIDYRLPYTGCESLAEAGERVATHLRSCAAELATTQGGPCQLKLLVGHGGAFRHAALHLGLLSREEVAGLSMEYGTPIYFEVDSSAGNTDRFVHIAGTWRQRSEAQPVD